MARYIGAVCRQCRREGLKLYLKGDKCYNCQSPERICNGLLIEFKKMSNIDMEVVLIGEELGL